MMQKLPSGCAVSKFYITPKNWNTCRASIKKNWFVQYDFFSPSDAVNVAGGSSAIPSRTSKAIYR